jgi:glycerate dehydrogenase
VLVYSRTIYPQFESSNLKFVDLPTLLSNSDFVSLHCPLTAQTNNLINMEMLKKMKPSAVLINSSRGAVVNEADLAAALNEDIISAAALDVLCYEPMRDNCPLKDAKNVIITPHIAWAPLETRQRLLEIAKNNIRSFLNGEPINVVS